MKDKKSKSYRLLSMYQRLKNGENLDKQNLADDYGISLKSVQRDIDDLRIYLADTYTSKEAEAFIVYNRSNKQYELVEEEKKYFQTAEVLSMLKILLESRAFNKNELELLVSKIVALAPKEDHSLIKQLLIKELHNYVELQHGSDLFDAIKILSEVVINQTVTSITYRRQDGKESTYPVLPVAILFSEYYFYLVAYYENGKQDYPTSFRIDRIQHIKKTNRGFKIPYADKFNDGEFRKRVQFMYSGPLKWVKFECSELALEPVLDRLPTAKILKEKDGIYTIEAESYGDGIDMFLDSQGEKVRILN